MHEFQIIIGGEAGQGSKKAGLMIAKLFNAYGYNIFIHEDYESLIKGGHNFSHISIAKRKIDANKGKIDFLLALNEDTISKHKEKIKEGGVLVYDADIDESNIVFSDNIKVIKVPLFEIVSSVQGIDLMKNTALVSAFSKIVGMNWDKVQEVLRKELPIQTEKNIQVADTAFQRTESLQEIEETGERPLSLVSGNEAVAMGAIDAGVEAYFAYPMTPSTSILRFFVNTEGIKAYQPENEIAAISMVTGAAYAGKRAMTGTSGGGFALMTETISFCAQAEIPAVIALCQRMGPATGVPTYQSQGDLLFALNSGHGDMKRFVVAPGDANEAYYLGGLAVNIAWKYQMPSIILLDKELSENTYQLNIEEKVKKDEAILGEDNENYNRYDGEDISPLLFPGGKGIVKVTGYEHDKKGVSTEDSEQIIKMQDKRMRKYKKLTEEVESMEAIKTYKEGKVAVFFWGSTKGAVITATEDMSVKLIQPLIMQPFPQKQIKEALFGVEKIICVENNSSGQLAQVLSEHGIKVDKKILKYDGRPFIIDELREMITQNL